MNIRLIAAKILTPVVAGEASVNGLLDQHLKNVPAGDQALVRELCLGSLRFYHQLECIAKKLLSKPPRAKDLDIMVLIVIGLYQLKHMRIPDHAAISETVEAARQLNKGWATKLINAVLRNFLRQRTELELGLENDECFRHSHPAWLIDKLKTVWPEYWLAILEANNLKPPLTLRVNINKISIAAYCQLLDQHGIKYQRLRFSDAGLQLLVPSDVPSLPGFDKGLFSVQDEAAQLSAHLLSLAPRERILDACCAPGGKTSLILEAQPQLTEVVAVDVDETRMARTRENLNRLGHSATLKVADASAVDSWWDGHPFDGVLLDAPCSATGVIRRHPDIKLLRRRSDLVKLAQLQAGLLRALWPTLKPGGVLVYATCSVLPEENEDIVSAFVAEQITAIHDPIEANWGISRPFGRQLFPRPDGHDGFYYARIIKTR